MVGRSILYYPIVGLLIGLSLAALWWLLSGTPPLVAAVLILISWVLITGGLHLDGLADSADAWVGGMANKEKTLTIMKDPNCGPAGVVAILLLLLLKFVALYTLLLANEWVMLILATTLGRTILPLLFLTTTYVRPNGLGAILVSHMPQRLTILILAITTVLTCLTLGLDHLWVVFAILAIFWLLQRMMVQRIGGTTGDTAGALVEIIEVAVLVMVVLS